MTKLYMAIGVPGFDFGDIMSAPISEKKKTKNKKMCKISGREFPAYGKQEEIESSGLRH